MKNFKFAKKLFWDAMVPTVLLLFGVIFPVIINSAISVISTSYPSSIFNSPVNKELHKGNMTGAYFIAKENHLGIVAVRFNTFNRINSDTLIFRIKEKGQERWYYSGEYKVDQFQPNDFFTFGFPVINNSKGRGYFFQLESIKGQSSDAVAVSPIDPTVITKYQFSKSQLLTDKKMLLSFALKKIFYAYSDIAFATSTLPYFVPLFLYLAFFKYKKEIYKLRKSFLYIFTLSIFLYALFANGLSLFSNLFFIVFWVFITNFNRLGSSVSFLYSFSFLLFSLLTILFNNDLVTQNFAIISFYFLLIGTIQGVLEQGKSRNKLSNSSDVIKDIIDESRYLYICDKLKSLMNL